VEVTGGLDGWDASVQRVGEASQDSDRADNVIITLHRAKGPLIFDLGICLVLFALPALAFAVAIQIALGRRKFVPPFVTWFAAMLFAVIPIRNFLPGAPPPGAWIDQALVLWVLIALVTAMGLYMLTWYRQSE
jgi:drug/metabolite transporter (DMT)-like permease